MKKSDDRKVEGCVVWTLAVLIGCAMIVIEVLVGQWLFGVFGWEFGFWKMLGILLAINFIFSGIRYHGNGKG